MKTSYLSSLPTLTLTPATPPEPGKRRRLLAMVPATTRPIFSKRSGEKLHIHSGDPQWFMDTISCQAACPARTDVARYIAHLAAGDHDGAYKINQADNLFPGILGRTCARPCESACRRGKIDDPIAICALKRGAADYRKDFRLPARPELRFSEPIAIVGAGPTGLAAAAELAQWGYPVTIFDALPVAGGLLRSGIPEFRLPSDLLKAEVDDHFAALGVTFRLNTHIGRDVPLSRLLKDYQAVYLAAGTQAPSRMKISGEEHPAIVSGLAFMETVNLRRAEARVGKRVVVIGGGFTALDCCRSAVRLGAEEVRVLYRRSKAEMSATKDEIGEAEVEGVRFDYLVAPVSVRSSDTGEGAILRCIHARLSAPGPSGRREAIQIPGSEFEIEVDTIIAAVGQQADISWLPSALGLSLCGGKLQVDPLTFATGIPGLFAGGDFTAGSRNIISAVADGRKAALAIHHTFRSRGEGVQEEEEGGRLHLHLGTYPEEDEEERISIPLGAYFEQVNVEPTQSTYHRELEQEINETIAAHPSQQSLPEAFLARPVNAIPTPWTTSTLERRRKHGDDYEETPRQEMPTIPVPERADPDREVESGFTSEAVATEARRCLQCQMNIFIDGQVCILCNACVDVCPVNVISMVSPTLVETLDGRADAPALAQATGWKHGAAMIIDEDLCVRCGLCVQYCPTKCLTMQSFTPQPKLAPLVQVGRGKRPLPVHM